MDSEASSELKLDASRHGETWVGLIGAPLQLLEERLSEGMKWALTPFLAHQVY